jgi:hypothetical protein
MGCLGVHFALTEGEVKSLRSISGESDRLEYIKSEIETRYFGDLSELKAESDKAWDAMHRALSDGTLSWDGGTYPLNHTVLAGELLYTESDYIVSLKNPQQVRDIAKALSVIDESSFRRRYLAIDPEDYGLEMSEEDFGYTWEWFQEVRNLYLRAASEDRFVLFTADQ